MNEKDSKTSYDDKEAKYFYDEETVQNIRMAYLAWCCFGINL